MSTAHSAAMRRHWQTPAFRAKMAARIRADEGVTDEIVRLRDQGMTWKDIGAHVHMTETSARHRYERGKLAALEAENQALQRQLGEASAQLSVQEEGVAKLRAAWKSWNAYASADGLTRRSWRDMLDDAIVNVIGEQK